MKEREFVWLHFVLKVLTRQEKDNIYIYIYIYIYISIYIVR
jgi:hypothetical protein